MDEKLNLGGKRNSIEPIQAPIFFEAVLAVETM